MPGTDVDPEKIFPRETYKCASELSIEYRDRRNQQLYLAKSGRLDIEHGFLGQTRFEVLSVEIESFEFPGADFTQAGFE